MLRSASQEPATAGEQEPPPLWAESAVVDLVVSRPLAPLLLREAAPSPKTRMSALFALSCGDTPLVPCAAADARSFSAQKAFARQAERLGYRCVCTEGCP